jgi:hypothetical protein
MKNNAKWRKEMHLIDQTIIWTQIAYLFVQLIQSFNFTWTNCKYQKMFKNFQRNACMRNTEVYKYCVES